MSSYFFSLSHITYFETRPNQTTSNIFKFPQLSGLCRACRSWKDLQMPSLPSPPARCPSQIDAIHQSYPSKQSFSLPNRNFSFTAVKNRDHSSPDSCRNQQLGRRVMLPPRSGVWYKYALRRNRTMTCKQPCWRNGSAWDFYSQGCRFESCIGLRPITHCAHSFLF